ncbi:DUF998 domain-containing protein [Aurantivibrio plasticivorans]
MMTTDHRRDLVISFLTLRKSIGVLGISLPFVMVLGHVMLGETPVLPDLSSYYFGPMGDVFVGILCATAVFSFAYRGPERKDDIAGDIVAVSALGVAFFGGGQLSPTPEGLIAQIHSLAALVFFLTLSYFCIFLFTKSGSSPTPQKLKRNRIYKLCGYTMLLMIAGMGVYIFLREQHPQLAQYNMTFWMESVAQVAFGIAWFTKGEGLLKDK